MTNRSGLSSQKATVVGCALLFSFACSSSSGGGTSGGAPAGQTSGSVHGGSSAGGSSIASSASGGSQVAGSSSSQVGGQAAGSTSSGEAGKTTGGQTTGTTSGGQGGKSTPAGRIAGNTGSGETGGTASAAGATGAGGGTAAAGTTGSGTGGKSGGSGGQAGGTSSGGKTGSTVDGGVLVSSCTGGKEWPTADPTKAGPFAVAADKGVGPLAGYTPDPIYGDQQQHFNIYRPRDLTTSGYCHPILVWANGHTDNPEPNPPLCVTDSAANKWCGQYLPMMQHLASHGFVVIASLSTTTSKGDPLPTKVGLDWLVQQAEDPTNTTYFHHLDTANIGQLGHSEGAMSTCMSASEPRYKALASICGTTTLKGVHTPFLFFCGGKDTVVGCDNPRSAFLTVTDQPAILIDELNSDHGSWVYQGAKGVSLSMAAAWFRVHLMGDTANRKYFYGSNCTFCTDSRVKVEQNSLMTQ